MSTFAGEMKKLYIETYGCQMNVADSEVVASIMQMAGYELCESVEEADAVFLNTCSVRENAENKIYHRLEALNNLRKRRNGFREAPEHQLERKNANANGNQATTQEPISFEPAASVAANAAEAPASASPAAVAAGGTVIGAPAPAVSVATAEAMETATTAYVERLEQLNETLQKVEQLSARLATDSEEMENLNRTLTGIARVYEMQLKSASQQITTQDSINEQTQLMADKIRELNSIYARMIEAMTTNMPKA